MPRIVDRLPIAVYTAIAGIIVGVTVRDGLPKTDKELAIYLSWAVMGLLTWLVQRVVDQQGRLGAILENHLGEIGKSLSVNAEISRMILRKVNGKRAKRRIRK